LKGVEYKIIGADGREYAASTLDELRRWVEDGRVAPGTWVWNGEEQRWQPASAWPELQWDLPAVPPVLPPVPAEPGSVNAEFPMRAAAFVIDFFVMAALYQLVTMPWAEEIRALQEASSREWMSAKPDLMVMLRFQVVFLGTYLPLRMAYFVGFHGSLGATPGKMLFGLRVIRMDGEPLSFPRAFGRFLAELVSISALFVGYLIAPFHPEQRALHDLVAGTRVVRRSVG
jgi:uncharacterized RDD family membrane protein YckC